MFSRPRKPGPPPNMGQADRRGQNSPHFKRVMSDEDALLIRQFVRNAKKILPPTRQRLPHRFLLKLAAEFNVSKSTVKRIIARKTYKHVKLSGRRWG